MQKISGILAFALIVSLSGCTSSVSTPTTSNLGGGGSSTSTVPAASSTPFEVETAEKGLDLQAVAEIAKKAKNAEDLEKLLNQPESVNNLDLDEDGKVDYISVTEFTESTENARGFSLWVDLGNDNVQEIATILLEREGARDETIDVYVAGNEEIYGTDDYYTGILDDDSSFASWSYGKRPRYASPYRYGLYPAGFAAFTAVGLLTYRARTKSFKDSSLFKKVGAIVTKAKLKSPHAGRSASNIKAVLAKPNAAQTAFQKTNSSRATKSSTSTTSRPSSSFPSDSSSSSKSSSSSSSSRSSSSSSRSSSGRRR